MKKEDGRVFVAVYGRFADGPGKSGVSAATQVAKGTGEVQECISRSSDHYIPMHSAGNSALEATRKVIVDHYLG